jgi:DNA-binding transcriptional LysR family regulator
VASASNPSAASSFAVPASHGLGIRRHRADHAGPETALPFPTGCACSTPARRPLFDPRHSDLSRIKQICYLLLSHSFLHGLDVDSDALNTFLIVYRRGGISNAAKALHRSQPAISRRIALLEEELGVPLFERIAGRTVLSDAGKVMVPYAERAVAAAEDAENAVRALMHSNSGPVALAVVGTLAGGGLAAIMKQFAREHPGVDLTLRTATSGEVSGLIRRGEATIGLRYDVSRSDELEYERLFTEPLQVVCAPDHPRAGSRVARLADLCLERWIAFPEVPGRREITASHAFALFQTHRRNRLDTGRQSDRAEASDRSGSGNCLVGAKSFRR